MKDGTTVALLHCRTSQKAAPFLYELPLRWERSTWSPSGETVTPWPDPAAARGFLSPRQDSSCAQSNEQLPDAARHDPREVIADPHVRYFGAELNERTLIPGDGAQLGETRFADWLKKSAAVATAAKGA